MNSDTFKQVFQYANKYNWPCSPLILSNNMEFSIDNWIGIFIELENYNNSIETYLIIKKQNAQIIKYKKQYKYCMDQVQNYKKNKIEKAKLLNILEELGNEFGEIKYILKEVSSHCDVRISDKRPFSMAIDVWPISDNEPIVEIYNIHRDLYGQNIGMCRYYSLNELFQAIRNNFI